MVGTYARKSTFNLAIAGFLACAVGLGPMAAVAAASPARSVQRAFAIDCGPGRTGPDLRLTREVRPGGDRAIVTLSVSNAGPIAAKGARFAEDLSGVSDGRIVGEPQATEGRVTYSSPLIKWTGDLPAGGSVTVRYAVPPRPGRAVIRTVDADAGATCHPSAAGPDVAGGGPDVSGHRHAQSPVTAPEQALDQPAAGRHARQAHKAPVPFSSRFVTNLRGAVTRAGNTVLSCYPPAVPDCATRRNGLGNNNGTPSTYVDVDGDASTFNSSTADLQMSPGANVAFARLYWGGRSETMTDTPGLPAGNRFSPAIAQRTQVQIKAPGAAGYLTATASSSGDTPDGVTAGGIVYGASADVTSLVQAFGAGTYTVGNIQAGRGSDNLGAFGGWSLVVVYGDPTLPLRNITLSDGFFEQQPIVPDTAVTLSGFQTPASGSVNVQLGDVAYDGDNVTLGDFMSAGPTSGSATPLTDALHPADNFFNSTIATLGSQVTARNPSFTNTLGYDSNIVDASLHFGFNETSAQVVFGTTGDIYWPQAVFSQSDLNQADIQTTKSAQVVGGGPPAPGSVVEYTITATNTGDDTAVNVLLSDPIPADTTYVPGTISVASGPNAGAKTDQPGDDQAQFVGNTVSAQLGNGANAVSGGTLVPGQSTSVTFRVTLGPDSPGTTVTNTATVDYASAEAPSDAQTSIASASVTVPASVSSLALLKTANPTTVTAAGQTVTYSYQVTNTGNTTLTGISAADTAFTGTGTPPVITCPVTTLAPQESTTCTGTYGVTQADIDAGSITNTATASGTPPTGPAVTSNPSTATVTAAAAPSLALLKTAAPSTVTSAGQTVTYSYLTTNTGNTTLTGVSATDTAFSGTGTPPVITCPVTTLVPQASTTCTGTYVVTQADIDTGSITNTATASGTPPTGPAVTSNPSTATVTTTPGPALVLLKTATPSSVTAAGQTVTYNYLVTNTGDVTLTGVSATDTAFSGTGTPPVITCPVTTLAPQASTTCTGTYTVTQADIDAGSTTNTATASGTPPTGPAVTSNASSATVTTTSVVGLALLKTAAPSTVTGAGQTVTYSYLVTNTGNTTLTGVTAVDTAFSGSGTPPVITCPVTTLAPQASTTCTGTYTVTQADVNAASITNTATASGTPPTGPAVTSDPSTATVTIPSSPSLALLKTAVPTTVTAAGQTVTYSYLVTNTGNATLTGVSATDTAFSGTGTPPVITCPVTTLAPQASTTCTGTYTVTQADIDTGSITNTATASGTPPTGPAVTSNPSTATVTATTGGGLTLLKTATPTTVTAPGQTVTYAYLITNTGNTAVTEVGATDTVFSGTGRPPVITCPTTTLDAHEPMTCTGRYVTTPADAAAGAILNTATASGTLLDGTVVTSDPSTATVITRYGPPSTVVRSGTRPGSYAVANNGSSTLADMDIKNGVASITGVNSVISCPIKRLAPGRSITCVVMGEHHARHHRVHHRPHVHRRAGRGHRNLRHRL